MGKNIAKNIIKNLSGNYSRKPFDHAKHFARNALVALKAKFWYTQDVSKNPI